MVAVLGKEPTPPLEGGGSEKMKKKEGRKADRASKKEKAPPLCSRSGSATGLYCLDYPKCLSSKYMYKYINLYYT